MTEPIAPATIARLIESPILGSVQWALQALARTAVPIIEALNLLAAEQDIRTSGGARLKFVLPWVSTKAFADQYEVRVFERGEVATRPDNWHDFFNALVWLSYPRTKAMLNRRHYTELERNFGAPLRGTARDMLTLFDEGGAFVATTDTAVREQLRTHRWKDLFWHGRARLARSTRFFVFGHAILERTLAPFAGATAKALVIDVDRSFMTLPSHAARASIDASSAAYFAEPDALTTTRKLGALPVLGIPGWTAENACASYYDDTRYFRPLPRTASA